MKRQVAALLMVAALACPFAHCANNAPEPLSSLLPGPGITAGVDLANECKSGSVLPVANGGSGVGGTPSNGQLAIGNGTGFTLNTLTAGAGISRVNGAGSITVSNTGVTSNVAGTGIGVSGATGAVTISNSGVTSAVAGAGVAVSGATGAVTISANPIASTALLAAGTSGPIVSATVTAASIIVVSYKGVLVNPGHLSVTPGAGTFTIDSDSVTDAGTVAWYLAKP